MGPCIMGDPENAGALSDFVSYLIYVSSYYALLPLLFQEYQELGLQI